MDEARQPLAGNLDVDDRDDVLQGFGHALLLHAPVERFDRAAGQPGHGRP